MNPLLSRLFLQLEKAQNRKDARGREDYVAVVNLQRRIAEEIAREPLPALRADGLDVVGGSR